MIERYALVAGRIHQELTGVPSVNKPDSWPLPISWSSWPKRADEGT